MQYKCEKCGYEAEAEGMCPTCNIPMTAKSEGAPATEATDASAGAEGEAQA